MRNNHPMSTTRNLSPNQLWIQGIAVHGFAPEAGDIDYEVSDIIWLIAVSSGSKYRPYSLHRHMALTGTAL